MGKLTQCHLDIISDNEIWGTHHTGVPLIDKYCGHSICFTKVHIFLAVNLPYLGWKMLQIYPKKAKNPRKTGAEAITGHHNTSQL